MSDLEIRAVSRNIVQNSESNKKLSALHCGDHYDKYACFLKSEDSIQILVFEKESLNVQFIKEVKLKNSPNLSKVQIVGHENYIFLLDGVGNLYKFTNEDCGNFIELDKYYVYVFELFHKLNFKKVFGIAEYQNGFAVLGLCENGNKMLKVFEMITLPDFVDYTFSDLNMTQSNNYYLNTLDDYDGLQSLIVSDKLSGRTYLCSNKTQVSLTHYSNLQLISAISIKSENCYLLCFENGKIVIYSFSNLSSDQVLFLTQSVVCIKKCLCNDKCFLWTNGSVLHHTELHFDAGSVKMTHFKMEHNITGITYFAKVDNIIVASTINGICYIISKSQSARKELVQRPGEILSQVYKESLKINNFQKNLKTVSEYLNLKETIQNNDINMELNSEENYIEIKNKSKITFKKEFWKIQLKMFVQGCEWVKVVELETDLVKEMKIKIQNPFANEGKVKIYFLGEFEWEILCFFIGMTGKEADSKNNYNLKKKLNEIKYQKNPNIKKE